MAPDRWLHMEGVHSCCVHAERVSAVHSPKRVCKRCIVTLEHIGGGQSLVTLGVTPASYAAHPSEITPSVTRI